MENYNRFAVLIGNSEFPDKNELPNLSCPLKDVAGLNEVLSDPNVGGFKTTVLPNEPSQKVIEVIENVLQDACKEDIVLIYYSGHGKPGGLGDLHLATSNTKADRLISTSVPVLTICRMISNSKSTRIALILDCCFSGLAGKTFRGTPEDQLRLLAEEEGSGKYLVSASTDIQAAVEKEGDQYGVFTKHLLGGIREANVDHEGWVTIDALYKYLQPRVKAESNQKPMMWGSEVEGSPLRIAKSNREPLQAKHLRILRLIDEYCNRHELPEILKLTAPNVLAATEKVGPLRGQERLLYRLDIKDIPVHDFLVQWYDLEPKELPPLPPTPLRPAEFPEGPEDAEQIQKKILATMELANHLAEQKKYREARAKYQLAQWLQVQLEEPLRDEDRLRQTRSKVSEMEDKISTDVQANEDYLTAQINICEELSDINPSEAIKTLDSTIAHLEGWVATNIIIPIPPDLFRLLDKLADKSAEQRNYRKAIELLEFRLELPEELTDESLKARVHALQRLAEAMLREGNNARINIKFDAAAYWLDLSLEFFGYIGDQKNLAETYKKLGQLAEDQNLHDKSSDLMKKSEELRKEHEKEAKALKERWPSFGGLRVVKADFVIEDGELVQNKITLTFQNVGKLTWREGRRIRLEAFWTDVGGGDRFLKHILDQTVAPDKTAGCVVTMKFLSWDGQHRIEARVLRTPWQKSDDKVRSENMIEKSRKDQPWKLAELLPPDVQGPAKGSFRIDLYTRLSTEDYRGKIKCLLTREQNSFDGIDKEAIAGFIAANVPPKPASEVTSNSEQ
jgi:hypothetical protein